MHETTAGYLIGGWSMGGTVAQRVAVQWRDQGIAVGALVLIDSNSPDRIRALTGMNDREVDAEFARRYLRSLQAFGAKAVDASAVTESDPASGVARALAGQGLALKDVERRISVFTRHLAGLAQLRARPLVDVPTLLVIAEYQSPANSGVGMGVDDARDTEHLGWGDNLPTSTTEIMVPGHHYSVLSAPGLEIISEQIRELLV
nr:thioesterase domain-containing protein [Corynebacterium diphtheriae]